MDSPSPSFKLIWDLSLLENRQKTYDAKWKVDFLTVEEMAKAGFYFSGTEDLVKCVFCPISYKNWKQGDVPLDVHRREFPDCHFFKNKTGVNTYNT